ncbi:hypothetical protein TNCV_4537851 [Trichonephila clavipes]|nr:hypothetical protein TNCV_4537851 [Trichonephila clavipes]
MSRAQYIQNGMEECFTFQFPNDVQRPSPIPLIDTAPSSLSSEALSSSTLSMFTPLPACSVLETTTTTSNTIPFTSQAAKQTSKTCRKRRLNRSINPKIYRNTNETPHKLRKSTHTFLQDTSDEDMLKYKMLKNRWNDQRITIT